MAFSRLVEGRGVSEDVFTLRTGQHFGTLAAGGGGLGGGGGGQGAGDKRRPYTARCMQVCVCWGREEGEEERGRGRGQGGDACWHEWGHWARSSRPTGWTTCSLLPCCPCRYLPPRLQAG